MIYKEQDKGTPRACQGHGFNHSWCRNNAVSADITIRENAQDNADMGFNKALWGNSPAVVGI